jgi:hypothetical protein
VSPCYSLCLAVNNCISHKELCQVPCYYLWIFVTPCYSILFYIAVISAVKNGAFHLTHKQNIVFLSSQTTKKYPWISLVEARRSVWRPIAVSFHLERLKSPLWAFISFSNAIHLTHWKNFAKIIVISVIHWENPERQFFPYAPCRRTTLSQPVRLTGDLLLAHDHMILKQLKNNPHTNAKFRNIKLAP